MTNEELYYLPASELLRHIQDEKERLIKEKVIKKSKPLLPITDEEKPYKLPEGWEWARLEQISTIISSKNYQVKTKDIIEIGSFPVVSQGKSLIEGYSNESSKLLQIKNPVIIFGDHTKIVKYIDFDFIVGAEGVKIINPLVIQPKFLYFALVINSNKSDERGYSRHFQFLNKELVPIPPLYIQDQIVQKLEQLSETKESLLSHAESQLNYTKKMREVLLQEAIRGELVPQDEHDEPASILLEKIKVEKERLIKEKVIKKSKQLPPITEEEKPYELPESWEWVRLGNVIKLADNLNIQTKLNSEDMIHYLDIDSIDNSNQTVKEPKFEPVKNLSTRARRVLKKDMIVYSMVRPYLKNMAMIKEDKENYIGSTGFIAFEPIWVKKEYIFNFLRSDYVTNILNSFTVGFNSPSINMDQFNELHFPLPSLAEQERIVAKLDELMAYCDELEAKAEEIRKYAIKLFEASLNEAFMPE